LELKIIGLTQEQLEYEVVHFWILRNEFTRLYVLQKVGLSFCHDEYTIQQLNEQPFQMLIPLPPTHAKLTQPFPSKFQ
jgi:hypothetical protein